MKFAFWNIGKNNDKVIEDLKILFADNALDILILAENDHLKSSSIEAEFKLHKVENKGENKDTDWIQIFVKDTISVSHLTEYAEEEIEEVRVDIDSTTTIIKKIRKKVNRVQLYQINGDFDPVYLACIHFPSKLYQDEISQWQIVEPYKDEIHKIAGSNRVIIVGDFNMNPFDYGMVEPRGFNAHNNIEVVSEEEKEVFHKMQPFYYNPCWSLLGDFISSSGETIIKRQGGSHYFAGGSSRKIKWYLIDQVIFQKSLIRDFEHNSLKIVENDKWVKQMKISNKNKKREEGLVVIDHLPLVFEFNFKKNK